MIRSAVTICLVPEARQGPFVFHGNLEEGCAKASALGFDGVEIFAPSGQHLDTKDLGDLLGSHQLDLAAVGTGAGMVIHGLSLSAFSGQDRQRACAFVKDIIDFGARFAAPAIIGSMQGRSDPRDGRKAALDRLGDSLSVLARHAARRDQPLLFEPLNRYETDLVCTLAQGTGLLDTVAEANLLLLADLFHMNIEERDLAAVILDAGSRIGHVHFVDSNRQAAGLGHLDLEGATGALKEAGYNGFASVEAFPLPTPDEAARRTIDSFRRFFGA